MNQVKSIPSTPELRRGAKIVARPSRSPYSRLMVFGYQWRCLRPAIRYLIDQFEGGTMYSPSLRAILREQYAVEAGMYSYGQCLKPGVLPPGTTIGRYCSFADEIQFFRRNHPKDRLSLHPFFYNDQIGIVPQNTVPLANENPLSIGHDVWIGFGAAILPNCRLIGNGAIIGACAVVTKDVPAFSIAVGNPAKVIGQRFSQSIIETIDKSQWWLKPIDELTNCINLFVQPMSEAVLDQILSLASDQPKGS